jgi:hypothetical protein
MTLIFFHENRELYTWLILPDLSLITIAFGDVRCTFFKTLLLNFHYCTVHVVWIISLTFGTGVLHLIQINHKPDATIFQFIILTFVYSSTCFGRFLAHHQELNDCSGSLWFYLRIVVIADSRAVFVVGPADPTTNTARLSPRYEGKTRGCHCSH